MVGETQLELLDALVDGPLTVGELTEQTNSSIHAISNSLRRMARRSLITRQGKGQQAVITLTTTGLLERDRTHARLGTGPHRTLTAGEVAIGRAVNAGLLPAEAEQAARRIERAGHSDDLAELLNALHGDRARPL